jgi:hypothetical protein
MKEEEIKKVKIEKVVLKKKDYMSNEKKFLRKGKILPIYVNWKNQEDLMGFAKLNFRVSDSKEEYPYERASIGDDKQERYKEQDLVIYKFQRWNITFVDPFDYDPHMEEKERWKYLSQKGFTTNWNIAYFEAVDSNYIS